MEEFSQSRGDDDLFSDEIIPLQPSQQEPLDQQIGQLSVQPSAPSAQPERSSFDPQHHSADSGRGRGRDRGAGRPRARANGFPRGSGGLHESKYAPKQNSKSASTAESTKRANPESTTNTESSSLPLPEVTGQEATRSTPLSSVQAEGPATDSTQEKAPPAGPSQPANKTPAVRGDRTATGGLPKHKLTQEELDAKMAAMGEKSKVKSEQFARSQADAASFNERERLAEQDRRKEVVQTKKLEGEREQNRARKLRAVGGREWDADKNEDDFRQPKYGESIRRGPVETQQDLSIYEWRDDPESQQGSGRGRGRGRGGNRGRGRGFETRGGRGAALMSGSTYKSPSEQSKVPTTEDFPALPGSGETGPPDRRGPRSPNQQRKDSDMAPGGSWADQMAS